MNISEVGKIIEETAKRDAYPGLEASIKPDATPIQLAREEARDGFPISTAYYLNQAQEVPLGTRGRIFARALKVDAKRSEQIAQDISKSDNPDRNVVNSLVGYQLSDARESKQLARDVRIAVRRQQS